jgi:hypothetical protein
VNACADDACEEWEGEREHPGGDRDEPAAESHGRNPFLGDDGASRYRRVRRPRQATVSVRVVLAEDAA